MRAVIADLQLHSKFARAVSKDMTISGITEWAQRKGIDLLATGDWTHPLWMKEIQNELEETGNGTLRLKTPVSVFGSQLSDRKENVGQLSVDQKKDQGNPLFLLATEVSCIYSQGGKGHRVHTLIWVPTIDSALKINKEFTRQGCNLVSDGRPIIGLSNIQVAELVLTIEPRAMIIPAHAWTPWFSVFGSMSGFDSIKESFGPYSDQIFAIETGLSSNPAMNWQIKELDTRSIVSFSDAHSGPKLGREATVFSLPDGPITYDAIASALKKPYFESLKKHKASSASDILYTIEFYPEEGKYHFTGHRNCSIHWSQEETKEKGTDCPVCGKPLTQGVLQRVEELSGRTLQDVDVRASYSGQLLGISTDIRVYTSQAFPQRKPYIMLVPLLEIIAECLGSPVTSTKVRPIYDRLTESFGGEFGVLLHATIPEIKKVAGDRIAEGVKKVRSGDIVIDPGYDGVFGTVKLWRDDEEKPLLDSSQEQLSMF